MTTLRINSSKLTIGLSVGSCLFLMIMPAGFSQGDGGTRKANGENSSTHQGDKKLTIDRTIQLDGFKGTKVSEQGVEPPKTRLWEFGPLLTVDQLAGCELEGGYIVPDKGCANEDRNACDAASPFYNFRLRGGLSHYEVNDVDSKTGGTWGIDGVLPLGNVWGGYGGYKLNHISGGRQTLASGGFYKVADNSGEGFERVGVAALYDYFTDSRADDLDLSQIRVQAGYALNKCWSAGVRYSNGLNSEANRLFYRAGDFVGTWKLSQTAGAFVSGYLGDTLISAGSGWVKESDRYYADFSVRTPITNNLLGFIDGQYMDNGSMVGILGLEYRFGAGKKCRDSARGCWTRNLRSPWDDPTIGNIFNSGEAKTFGGSLVPGTQDATAPQEPVENPL